MSDRLIDAKALAKRLGVPASWVYDHTRPGQPNPLPHYRIGRYVRFDAEEILALLRRDPALGPSDGVVSTDQAAAERRAVRRLVGA